VDSCSTLLIAVITNAKLAAQNASTRGRTSLPRALLRMCRFHTYRATNGAATTNAATTVFIVLANPGCTAIQTSSDSAFGTAHWPAATPARLMGIRPNGCSVQTRLPCTLCGSSRCDQVSQAATTAYGTSRAPVCTETKPWSGMISPAANPKLNTVATANLARLASGHIGWSTVRPSPARRRAAGGASR
jgi:hypothetical protein